MYKFFPFRIPGLLILMILMFSCERTKQATHEEMEISVLKSGNLEISAKKDFPKSIYLDIRDETGNLPLTPEYLPKMLTADGSINAEVDIIYQSLEGLREAIPDHPGDWYFSGDYPTPGGTRLVNRAFINYYEGNVDKR